MGHLRGLISQGQIYCSNDCSSLLEMAWEPSAGAEPGQGANELSPVPARMGQKRHRMGWRSSYFPGLHGDKVTGIL